MLDIYLILGGSFLAFLVMVRKTTGGKVLTGSATVVSRRVEVAKYPGRMQLGVQTAGWNYLVTFRLSDGELIELYTFENEYRQLQEGLSGVLSWQKNTLSSFEPNKEET